MISCRNLLIYLQSETQKKLLEMFHYSLNNGGSLFLGTSETIGELSDSFDIVAPKAKLFKSKGVSLIPARPANFPTATGPVPKMKRSAQTMHKNMDVNESVAEMLLTSFAPATVVVDGAGDIVHVHGRTGRYLELAAGGSPNNIFTMARDGPRWSAMARDGPRWPAMVWRKRCC
ncbi:MAG: two-component system CheB/CheR fusion protein [Pirellulaceae bacterium]